MSNFAQRTDGLQNVLTGLGGPSDKATATQWTREGLLDRSTLETMYTEDDLMATIVDALPEDAVRAGWEIVTGSDEDNEAEGVDEEDPWMRWFRDHDLFKKWNKASKWARLYGGAAIVIGAVDGKDPSEPLDLDNLERIAWIQVVDMWDLFPHSFDNDFTSNSYNQPLTYTLYPTSKGGVTTFGEEQQTLGATPQLEQRVIHRTRVIRFEGDDIPEKLNAVNGYWGLSVLQKTYKKVERFVAVEQAMANRINESQYDVVFMHGLGEILDQNDGEKKVRQRILTMAMGKGPIKALVMDGEDRWENRVAQFTGLFEMYDAFASSLAAAVNMSRVRLFGEPPGGMSTDDKAGRKNWHDQVDAYRETDWRPGLEYLIEVAMVAKDGPTKGVIPDDWSLQFGDLEQMTPIEEATLKKTVAEADKLNWDMGVLSADEIRKSRFGGAKFGMDITLQADPLPSQEGDFEDPESFEPEPDLESTSEAESSPSPADDEPNE